MRPALLHTLFSSLESLPGIGPRTRKAYERLVGPLCVDLLYHLPSTYVARRFDAPLSQVKHGEIICVEVEVESYQGVTKKNTRVPMRVKCCNETGFLTVVFFHLPMSYIKKMLPVGESRVVSGKVERFGNDLQIVHPDYIVRPSLKDTIAKVEPQYALTQGVSQKQLYKSMVALLERLPLLPEWCTEELLSKHGWVSWRQAHMDLHTGKFSPKHMDRLAYDELLAHQLALKLIRHHTRVHVGQSIKGTGELQSKLRALLPFTLTQEQDRVIEEISTDQSSSARMMRLIQGDVGCGKTMVAFFAMLAAIEAGFQSAMMAPTEILAEQHFKTLQQYAEPLGVSVALLTGKTKAPQRRELLEKLKTGQLDLIVGTHALFQQEVVLSNLGLVVIDEQHRFGVQQRAQLADKGYAVDTLLMSATPIPRTLTLAIYGDMDCSQITQKPVGRKPIDTRVMPVAKMDKIVEGIRRETAKGNQVYWICPLVEESDKMNLSAVEDRYVHLQKLFGEKVLLIHGKMKRDEQERVMAEFKETPGSILVATTVIEVGVDCPNATIIVIEHAEHFGLSQLHQLRGRVGRGEKASTCLLLYERLTDTAQKRLTVMRQSNDGFFLAEEDLRLRGGGDILGVKQSGLPEYKVASLDIHFELLRAAAQEAQHIISQDPYLKGQRGEALRTLLYLFRYDQYLRYLQA
jgi:ATP-dependent DNA helicase RecG